MDKTRIAVIILVAIVAIGMLLIIKLGQGTELRGEYKLGWIGSDGVNYVRYQYKEFTGTEKKGIYVNEPCNITLRYSIGVARGKLVVELVAPSGDTVWARSFSNSTDGEATVTLKEPGWYRLVIIGDHTEGYFDISWSAK